MFTFNGNRYLTAAGPELHITDYGLGKVNSSILCTQFLCFHIDAQVYRVNRDSSAQTAFGYLGTREGQLSKPAGILLDDR